MLTIKFRHSLHMQYALQFQYQTINSSLRHRFVINRIQFRLICLKVWFLSPILRPQTKFSKSSQRFFGKQREIYVFHFINGNFVGIFTRISCPNLCLPSNNEGEKKLEGREGEKWNKQMQFKQLQFKLLKGLKSLFQCNLFIIVD